MILERLLLLPALASIAFSADDSRLTLYSEASHTAEQSSVIRVPAGDVCAKMQVRLPAALARTGPSATFKLHLDGRDLHAEVGEQNGEVILTVTTGEPRGFFLREDQDYSLQLVRGIPGSRTPLPQWTIVTWKRAYTDISRSTGDIAAPDITIESPHGGGFVFPKRPDSVVVLGSITPERDYAVTIAGETVSRDLTRSGWGFSRTIGINDRVREIEVSVWDHQGGSRRLFLPVR